MKLAFAQTILGIALITPISSQAEIEFNRDIRPILSDNCFYCHGPDSEHRKAGLRLDTEAGALAALKSGTHAIVSGDPSASELIKRITTSDENDLMPPPESGKTLSYEQITTLRNWISQGAAYQGHWAFAPLNKPELPEEAVAGSASRNAVDYYIQERLKEEGLTPSKQASRETLIRRATLDLTGLPPTTEEIDAFLADTSPNAFERVVDRLLNSQHFGEHQARYWLDLVRYGDTHGLHLDNYREMWPYRDWVINSFNENKPFNAFGIEQLAGDLLPDATRDQLIASGYNRCNVTTSEGGSIEEEVYVRNVTDRIQTTGEVFMGLTFGCAVCHDHKFDPISMTDTYSMFAYFNSLDGRALDGNRKDHAPYIHVPSELQQQKDKKLNANIAELKKALLAQAPGLKAQQIQWEVSLKGHTLGTEPEWEILRPMESISSNSSTLIIQDDQSVLASGKNPAKDVHTFTFVSKQANLTALRLEALTHKSMKNGSLGRSDNANAVVSEITLEVASPDAPYKFKPIKVDSIQVDHYQAKEFLPEFAIDGKPETGWALESFKRIENNKAILKTKAPFASQKGSIIRVKTHYESKYAKHALGRVRFSVSSDPIEPEKPATVAMSEWHHTGPFTSTSNGNRSYRSKLGPEGKPVDLKKKLSDNGESRPWTRRLDWVDGRIHYDLPGKECVNYIYRSIHATSDTKFKITLGSDDGVKVFLNRKEILGNNDERTLETDQHELTLNLKKGDNELLLKIINRQGQSGFYFKPEKETLPSWDLMTIADLAPNKRNKEQQQQLTEAFVFQIATNDELTRLRSKLENNHLELAELHRAIPTTLIYRERKEPKEAFILKRGEYEAKGDKVGRATPGFLPPMDESLPNDRLGYAKWLFSKDHPLTARVAVNRFWQNLFGTGIVKTSGDFGSQGELPYHPELLDHLSADFRDNGWNVKGLIKQMVMSATYRQDSKVTPTQLERDPENRLLARGPRFRLDAETIRDQALTLGGLLHPEIGGASVKPPQPDGLWFSVGYSGSNTVRFRPDAGEDMYRRSLYTFWKRTSPPPQMTTFDAPSREACTSRRERTNTPLQALVLMNEPQYLEASRSFALRILNEVGHHPKTTAARLFREATARTASAGDLADLTALFEKQKKGFEQTPDQAKQFIGDLAEHLPSGVSAAELAAWSVVANVILNLDETINKG